MKTYVVMLAGGRGSRMKASVNKVLMPLCGTPVIIRSLQAFSSFADETVIVVRPDEQKLIRDEISRFDLSFPFHFAEGGETRQQSVLSGLKSLSPDPSDIILIHDAARCLVRSDLIERIICCAAESGAGIPGVPVTSTYKLCDVDSFVSETPDRSRLFEIQTPQGFTADIILPASLRAAQDGIDCTDDASVLEHYGIPVKVVRGDPSNIKLTEPADLERARSILEGGTSCMRVGMGYDVHRLKEGRKLILCGVEVPFDRGLLGHSDADVALHALMDAMLGACALGDIGKHFPDTDDRYCGVSSVLLLQETKRILARHGFAVYNADITIAAQQPKLLPYIPAMRANTAKALGLSEDRISVKATTTEKLGFEGRMEGISAYAVCTVVNGRVLCLT